MIKWFCAAIIALLSGCTNEQIYHGAQANQRNECDKLQLSQREECLTAFEIAQISVMEYSDYHKTHNIEKNMRGSNISQPKLFVSATVAEFVPTSLYSGTCATRQ